MKKTTLILIFLIFIKVPSFSQVGVNTTDPQRTLDVNGNLRIRSISDVNADATYDRVLLMDSDGANTSGNVDFNSVPDFRLKMLDLSTLDQTQINEINKYLGGPVCIKGPIGDGGQPSGVITFPSGYEFRVQDVGFGNGQVQVRKSGASANAERKVIGGSMSGNGAITVDGSWKSLVTCSFQVSNSGKAILVIAYTAQTFEISLSQKNQGGDKVYSLCVAQTVK